MITKYPLLEGVAWAIGGALALGAALLGAGVIPTDWRSIVLTLVATSVLSTLPLVLRGARLHVGADGVTLERPGHRRFLPYASLESVDTDGPRLVLREKGGRETVVDMNGAPGALGPRIACDRIRLALGEAREPKRDLAAVLGSSSLPDEPRARIQALHELARGGADRYRVSPLSRDALWAVVDDPAELSSRRADALVALSARLDDDDRARLHQRCESTADPELRRLFEELVAETPDEGRVARHMERLLLPPPSSPTTPRG